MHFRQKSWKQLKYTKHHEIINFSRENDSFCSKKKELWIKHFYRFLDKKHDLNHRSLIISGNSGRGEAGKPQVLFRNDADTVSRTVCRTLQWVLPSSVTIMNSYLRIQMQERRLEAVPSTQYQQCGTVGTPCLLWSRNSEGRLTKS